MTDAIPWSVPDATEIVKLHAALVDFEGAPKPGCVEGAIGAAINGALYAVEEPEDADLISLAAFALKYFAQNQCFGDGNKRIAWAVVIRIFDLNDMRIVAEQDDAAELTLSVATKKSEIPEIRRWLLAKGRIVGLP